MDYTKIAEYQIELEGLIKREQDGCSHNDNITGRARQLELVDLIANERNKPTY